MRQLVRLEHCVSKEFKACTTALSLLVYLLAYSNSIDPLFGLWWLQTGLLYFNIKKLFFWVHHSILPRNMSIQLHCRTTIFFFYWGSNFWLSSRKCTIKKNDLTTFTVVAKPSTMGGKQTLIFSGSIQPTPHPYLTSGRERGDEPARRHRSISFVHIPTSQNVTRMDQYHWTLLGAVSPIERWPLDRRKKSDQWQTSEHSWKDNLH